MAAPDLTLDRLLHLRLRAQRLGRHRAHATAAATVHHLLGVQAQEQPAAALSIHARAAGLTAADVDRAHLQERSIVRAWAMRSTLHLIAADDLPWLLPFLGPRFLPGGRRRRAQLGLDEATDLPLLLDLLADHGPLTRAEIVATMAGRGRHLAGHAVYHLLAFAALQSLVCQGPDRDGEPAYLLLADWLPPGPALPAEKALADLARRYLRAYAPAAPEDFAHWSGLPTGQARAAWGALHSGLVEVTAAGRSYWLLHDQAAWLDEPPPDGPTLALLPAYDTYLLGYRDRDPVVPPAHARQVHPGGGVIRPVLLLDGRAVATWRAQQGRQALQLVVRPFDSLPALVRPLLEAQATRLGRFLGRPVALSVAAHP